MIFLLLQRSFTCAQGAMPITFFYIDFSTSTCFSGAEQPIITFNVYKFYKYPYKCYIYNRLNFRYNLSEHMTSSFETKTTYMFGGASKFWPLFPAIALVMWLSPFFMEQGDSPYKANLIGAIALMLGLCLRFSYHGMQIDAKRRCFRVFSSICGFKTGRWKNLPPLEKLLFTSSMITSHNTPNGISPTLRSNTTFYCITLVSEMNQPVHVIRTTDRMKALRNVEALADLLRLKVEETNPA